MGIRAKLFLVLFSLIVVSVGAVSIYISILLNQRLTEQIREDLRVRLELIRDRLERETIVPEDDSAWSNAVDELGKRSRARVTLIRRDGKVLADSEVPVDRLPSLENHSTRPEIVEALERGEGSSIRYSTTLSRRMVYVAVPFRRSGQIVGTVRAAEPLAAVEETLAHAHRALFSSILLAALIAAAVSILAADRVSVVVRSLTESAAKMAAGDLEIRTRAEGSDELAELGRALDLLAINLSSAMGALRKERDLLGGIVSAMHEGLLVLDGDGRIAMVNPALRKMLQLGPDLVGKYPLAVIRHPDFATLLEQCKGAGEPVPIEIELVALKPTYLLLHAVRIADTGGLLVVFVDVTEIRRLERIRTDFVANVSHELRTPITAIRGYAETLRAGALSDPEVAASMVEIIFRQSERLSRLVEDLLELSRLEGRELKLSAESVPLLELANRAADAVRPGAESKGIRLQIRIPEELRVLADERAVEQVLLNLLDNAVKYMPSGGEVRITAEARNGRCEIEVRDNGSGIEAKHLSRLFERFYRVDKGRSRDMGGTGLGLAIVKHLVAGMRGEVKVVSEPGVGSTFTVILPQAHPETPPLAAHF
jgi:two-component system phosphate regulon sensor histidine kinase PhoR